MNKIVYSPRYGGFGLSDEAMELYLAKAGIEYIAVNNNKYGLNTTSFLRKDITDTKRYKALKKALDAGDYAGSIDDNMFMSSAFIVAYEIKRHDKHLIEVIEELGEAADTDYSSLKIQEIQGDQYRIDEYDGFESVSIPEEIKWENVND